MCTACASFDFEEQGGYIITAKEALALDGATFVDARGQEEYDKDHVEGAVCLPMSALVVNEPYKNMAPDTQQINEVMSASGLTQDDTLLIYDDASNMQAARIQWTLNLYSNTNVLVVSGGYNALVQAGANMTDATTTIIPAVYETGDKKRKLVVSLNYIKALIDEPEENTVIVDTRSSEEFSAGTIPGSVHIEYVWNNYGSGKYKSPRDIRLTYLNKGLDPDTKIILFCKTSIRAAESYTALKDAGFKDVRIYDGAWLEYEESENPAPPAADTAPVQGDAS